MQSRRWNHRDAQAGTKSRRWRTIRLGSAMVLSALLATGGSVIVATAHPAGAQAPAALERYGPVKTLIGTGNGIAASGVATDAAGDVYMATGTGPLVELPVNGGVTVTLATPTAALVAVDSNGDIFTAPGGEGVVSELRAGSSAAVTVPLTGVADPAVIAVDRAGDLFVADPENRVVVELVTATSTQVTLPFTGLNYPTGLAVDTSGDVYLANANGSDVLELPAGSSTQVTVPLTGLVHPNGVAVDGSGNLYEADGNGQVTEWSRASGTQRTLPFAGLGVTSSIAVDSSGDVVVGDFANRRVLKLTPGGLAANPIFANVRPEADIAIDGAGNAYIPDFLGNRIVELAAGTDAPSVLAFNGLSSPNGVAVDAAGDVFVSQRGSQPVVELPAGSTTQIALPITASNGANGVAVDGHGDVFAIIDGNSIAELPAGSSSATTMPFPSFLMLYSSISADAAGDVVVSGDDQLLQTPEDLELTAGAGVPIQLPFVGLTYPGAVAFDGSGDVFASGQANTTMFELLNGSTTPYTLPTVTGLSNPLGIAVGSTGTLDVANFGPTGTVQQFPGLGPVTVPTAPTAVTAVPGDGQATVTFAPPASDGGWPITSYTVTGADTTTPSKPTVSRSVTGGPVTFTGLVNGDYYTFSVAATSGFGQGPAALSRPRAPGLVPGAPVVSKVTAGSGVVTLKLTPPPATNPPILFYTVVATNQSDAYSTGQTVSSARTSVKVTGLLNGDAYTFSVTASNEVGTGAASVPTVGVVPGAPGKPRTVKAKVAGGQATVTFRAPTSAGLGPIRGYAVSAIDTTDASRGGQVSTGTGSPLVVAGLTVGDSYEFTVSAINAEGAGLASLPTKPVEA